ncbi:unnamed protein product [Caenorhabditis angaria]|uniref:Nuclear receptor domain-containing protein n=1 Tax=Caenorhabditis angaria TaxID=860376 RepID=A0A9P1N8Q0_9PELO|nr:unnamed protein product [Caenorhabditis angaria]
MNSQTSVVHCSDNPSTSYFENILPSFLSDNDKFEENCLVCLRPANGKHYNVPCCHGCKSFFRRAITFDLIFKPCFNDKKCYTGAKNLEEIKKCRWCRYQKCFDVGMIPQFSTKRKCLDSVEKVTENTLTLIKPIEIKDPFLIIKMMFENLSNIDSKIEKLQISTYNPIIIPQLDDLVKDPCKLDLATKMKPMSGWPLTQLEYLEKHKMLRAKQLLIESGDLSPTDNLTDINVKDWLPFDIMMAIENIKTFDFFNDLTIEDRIILIRATAVMSMTISIVYFSFKSKKECYIKPDGCYVGGASKNLVLNTILSSSINKNDIQKKWKNGATIISYFQRDQLTFTEFLFIRALIICNPVLELSQNARNILEKERDKYSKALFNHCLFEHGKNGPLRFSNFLHYNGIFENHKSDLQDFMRMNQILYPIPVPKSRKTFVNQVLCLDLR